KRLHNRKPQEQTVHFYTMNSKVVIVTWSLLFIVATIMFWLLENNNSLVGMDTWDKLVQSMFNAVTPRSAGFSSINPAGFLNVTIVMILFLMWIGGASQSTAGGVKVNTLALIWLNMKSTVTGRPNTSVFHRTISVASIRRANTVIAISLFSYTAYSIVLLWMEPSLPARQLLFESCSALFTVGSSLGATPLLGTPAKILLITAMFLGRVGIISLLSGIVGNNNPPAVRYPADDIIIN
ncbi:MAG: potassium transporter, partial [Muribaculaceae bacterium]|nr:potassium transporter [Muribaculaceae bacterium]